MGCGVINHHLFMGIIMIKEAKTKATGGIIMSNVYGYVRVSTKEQNEDRQLIALQEVNVIAGNIYMDKQSGKDFERPQYKKLLRK